MSAQKTYLFLILKNCVSKIFLLLSNTYWSSKLNHIQIIRQIKGHCHSGRTSKYMYRYVILERKADLSWYIGCVCRNNSLQEVLVKLWWRTTLTHVNCIDSCSKIQYSKINCEKLIKTLRTIYKNNLIPWWTNNSVVLGFQRYSIHANFSDKHHIPTYICTWCLASGIDLSSKQPPFISRSLVQFYPAAVPDTAI